MRYAVEDWSQSTFLAGQIAPSGHYLRVDAAKRRIVELSNEDVLPASLDGCVAEYVRLEDVNWLDSQRQAIEAVAVRN